MPKPAVRACPFCKEEIRQDAIKCKHCGSMLTAEESAVPPVPPPPARKNRLIWLGAGAILIGALLPWVAVRIESEMLSTGTQTLNGLQLNQGLLSLGVGILGAILSFVAAGRSIPAKVSSLAIAVIGIVVIGAAVDVIGSVGSTSLQLPGQGAVATTSSSTQPGVFVTLLGGALLFLGGIKAFRQAR